MILFCFLYVKSFAWKVSVCRKCVTLACSRMLAGNSWGQAETKMRVTMRIIPRLQNWKERKKNRKKEKKAIRLLVKWKFLRPRKFKFGGIKWKKKTLYNPYYFGVQ